MRVQLASDLHLEFLGAEPFRGWHGVAPTDADVLVLAGDIHQGTAGLAAFADWPVPVVFVPGNHEFYDAAIEPTRRALRDAARGLGLHLLDDDALVLDGVRFVGGTLWTDLALDGPDTVEAAADVLQRQILDFRLIRDGDALLTPAATAMRHRQSRRFLEQALAERFDGPTVVVTHHAPHAGSVHPRWAGNPCNPGFASHLPALVAGASLWLHGHMHDSFDYRVGDCRVVANPRGYPSGRKRAVTPADLRFENAAWNPALVVDVPSRRGGR